MPSLWASETYLPTIPHEWASVPTTKVPQTHTHTGGRQVKVCKVYSLPSLLTVSHLTKKFTDKVNSVNCRLCSVYSTWQNPAEILEFVYKNMHRNYGIWIHTSVKKCQLKLFKWLLIQGHQMKLIAFLACLISLLLYTQQDLFLFSTCCLFALGLRCFLQAFCSWCSGLSPQ